MFLMEPDQTPYDLRWRMFGIPVRVHPMFWLVSALMGSQLLERGVLYLALWVACVFVSVLIHEMGHVLMGRVFGSQGRIVLYSFGGLAISSNDLPNRWHRIAVCAAGPGLELLFFGVVLLIARYLPKEGTPKWVDDVIWFLFVINLFWGLINLLPVWPLDGGQISRDFLDWLSPANGVRISLIVSIAVAGVAAGLFAFNSLPARAGYPRIPYLPAGSFFTIIFFAMMAVSSFLALQALNQRRRDWDDDDSPPYERDPWR